MGAGNAHLKLKISKGEANFEVVAFGQGRWGDRVFSNQESRAGSQIVCQPMEWPNNPSAHAG